MIILGNCMEEMKKMQNESIDCILTDFPYNVGKDFENDSDKKSLSEYLFWLESILIELKRILKQNSNFVFYIGCKFIPEKLSVINKYFNYNWRIIQYKPTFRCFGKTGFTKSDIIWWFSKGTGKIYQKYPDIITDKKENMQINHPSFKGDFISEKLVEIFTKEDDTVLDPFAGSGSFLVALKKVNRNFIGIEINENYYKIAKDRIQNSTKIMGLFNDNKK